MMRMTRETANSRTVRFSLITLQYKRTAIVAYALVASVVALESIVERATVWTSVMLGNALQEERVYQRKKQDASTPLANSGQSAVGTELLLNKAAPKSVERFAFQTVLS